MTKKKKPTLESMAKGLKKLYEVSIEDGRRGKALVLKKGKDGLPFRLNVAEGDLESGKSRMIERIEKGLLYITDEGKLMSGESTGLVEESRRRSRERREQRDQNMAAWREKKQREEEELLAEEERRREEEEARKKEEKEKRREKAEREAKLLRDG